MTNEKFFKMLTVALLGLVAVAVVPETHADDAELTAEQVPVEISVVREVNEINAGRFDQVISGDEELVLSPVKTTQLTQIDPNL